MAFFCGHGIVTSNFIAVQSVTAEKVASKERSIVFLNYDSFASSRRCRCISLALLHLLLEEPVCTTESIERIGKEKRKSPAPNGIRTHDLDQWTVRPS